MITLKQIKLLEEAVDKAEEWRGMHVGAAPDWFMDDFDAEIKAMRKAVKAALGCRETIKQLKLELRREKRNAVKDSGVGTPVQSKQQ